MAREVRSKPTTPKNHRWGDQTAKTVGMDCEAGVAETISKEKDNWK
jgi:hypothetical protein